MYVNMSAYSYLDDKDYIKTDKNINGVNSVDYLNNLLDLLLQDEKYLISYGNFFNIFYAPRNSDSNVTIMNNKYITDYWGDKSMQTLIIHNTVQHKYISVVYPYSLLNSGVIDKDKFFTVNVYLPLLYKGKFVINKEGQLSFIFIRVLPAVNAAVNNTKDRYLFKGNYVTYREDFVYEIHEYVFNEVDERLYMLIQNLNDKIKINGLSYMFNILSKYLVNKYVITVPNIIKYAGITKKAVEYLLPVNTAELGVSTYNAGVKKLDNLLILTEDIRENNKEDSKEGNKESNKIYTPDELNMNKPNAYTCLTFFIYIGVDELKIIDGDFDINEYKFISSPYNYCDLVVLY